MRDRKQFRKLWILIKVVKAFGRLNSEQVNKVNSTNQHLSKQYSVVNTEVNIEDVEDRRARLAKSKDLRDVFEMFWVTLNPYCSNGILSKEGYIKCSKQV